MFIPVLCVWVSGICISIHQVGVSLAINLVTRDPWHDLEESSSRAFMLFSV